MKMALAFHCRDCLAEIPRGISPADYARQQVVLTTDGELAAWCNRHDKAIGPLTKDGQIIPSLRMAKCEQC